MDIQEAIRTRRSVRRFKADPVPENDIRAMIDLAIQAPSASNKQMWKFLAVTNKQALNEIRDAILKKWDSIMDWPEALALSDRIDAARGYSTFFADAPAAIIILGEPYHSSIDGMLEKRGWDRALVDGLRQRPDLQSIGAAIENLCLVAHSMGYGTCWMSAPCIAGPEIKELLSIEDPWNVIAIIPIGIPDESPSARPRKPVEEVLEFIR